jgi:hypothetical protein
VILTSYTGKTANSNADKRQFGGFGSFGGGGGSAAKAAVILKKLQPEYNPNATRAVYMYGPFKLPPKNVCTLH